jgi:hypothetical protein
MKRLCIVVSAIALLSIATSAAAESVLAPNRMNVYAFGGKSMTGRIGQADVEAVNFELGHAFSRRTELGVVLTPMNIRQRKSGYTDQFGDGYENVRAISTSLFVRYHFGAGSRVRPYAELSSGPVWSEKRVPAGTTRFNFISQGGVGVTIRPQDRYGIIVGWRFGHISNGGIEPDRNPGYNTNALILGVQFRPMPK